jgi:ribosomal protein S11
MNITRILFFGLAFFFTINFSAQQSVNDYKYIIVPEGYVFLRENDGYQLNSLTKFLFKKYGFTAFIRGDELPDDLKRNGCKGLRADVKKESGLLKTKLIVNLTDCNGKVIFSSKEGTSREKDFKKSYHEALRDAFKDVKYLKYKYNGKQEIPVQNKDNSVQEPKILAQSVVIEETPVAKNGRVATINETRDGLSKDLPITKAVSFTYNEETFFFESKVYGFELMQKKNVKLTSIGKVFKSSRKNNYIIQAGELSGIGYFDAYGNFVLERINPVTDKLITDIFARQ